LLSGLWGWLSGWLSGWCWRFPKHSLHGISICLSSFSLYASLYALLSNFQAHLCQVYGTFIFSGLNRCKSTSYVTKRLTKATCLCRRQEALSHSQKGWIKQAVLTLSKHVLQSFLSGFILLVSW
jgi:hypothetical protein